MNRKQAAVLLMTCLFSATSFAQEDGTAAPEETRTVASTPASEERARKRLYPGGRDEDSLQVQSQLSGPTRGGDEEPEEPNEHD